MIKPRPKPHSHTVPDDPMFSSARNNRCTAFFSQNWITGKSLLSLWRSLRFSALGRQGSEVRKEGTRGGMRWGQGGDSKNGVANWRHTVTPGPISRGHFSPEGERRRQPKITPLGPPSRPAADQSPGHGLIESRQSPLVGLIAPHHFRTSERSTSLLRDFYPDALARRAVPRHVLNWRV